MFRRFPITIIERIGSYISALAKTVLETFLISDDIDVSAIAGYGVGGVGIGVGGVPLLNFQFLQ